MTLRPTTRYKKTNRRQSSRQVIEKSANTRMQTDHDHWTTELIIASKTEAGREVVDQILAEMRRRSWPEGDLFSVHLALEEAFANAIKHGNQMDETKSIEVHCQVGDDQITIGLKDEGNGFAPDHLPDPTLDENLSCPSGRGVMLMRSFMSVVSYNDAGNSVTMQKQRTTGSDDAE